MTRAVAIVLAVAAWDRHLAAQAPPDPLDLDAALGLAEPAPEPEPGELERLLSPDPMQDERAMLLEALSGAAERLEEQRDTGLVTQRMQQDALRRIEQMIRQAQQMQEQSSSSSSSSSSDPSGQPNQPQPGQQQQPGQGDNRGEVFPPTAQDPSPGAPVAGSAEWGDLPERVREALRQTTSDSFSSLYRAMTEAYYRRLAEEHGR